MTEDPYKPLLNQFLQHLDAARDAFGQRRPQELYAPAAYMLSIGGKRVRPLMTLAGCALFGKDTRTALDAALAVELFHNFTLIHDDILDNAPLRRNQATVHEKWNRNIAILSGDMMLVEAFRAIARYDAGQSAKLTELLSLTAVQVCEGQQMDMNFEEASEVGASEYIEMITLKTAVLLACALRMGAVVAGAPEKDQQLLYDFGLHLGISFQLMDDLLDVFPEDPSFGKLFAGDIIANKKTFLLISAQEAASAAERVKLHEYFTAGNITDTEKIAGVTGIFRATGAAERCRTEAESHTAKALGLLEQVEAPATGKEALRSYSIRLLNRTI